MSSGQWNPHISETSSFLRYVDSIILCPMVWHKTMATAYLFKELISEICPFHCPELTHHRRALLYSRIKFIVDMTLRRPRGRGPCLWPGLRRVDPGAAKKAADLDWECFLNSFFFQNIHVLALNYCLKLYLKLFLMTLPLLW